MKPLAYVQTVQKITSEFETRQVEGLEADDLIGIMGTRPQYEGAVMVSLDKDFRTIPGIHFNPSKERKPVAVTLPQADRAWMYQTLIGDSTDNYKGCPGIGPKKADAFLRHPSVNAPLEFLWSFVVNAFRSKGLTERDALVQARVARILRDEDYNKTTKEVRLWHPTAPEWRTIESLVASFETTGKRTSARSGTATEGTATSATEA